MNANKKYCKAKTKKGTPCRANPGPDGYCAFHSPARAEAQRAAHKKGGETSPAKLIKLDGSVTLDSASKVNELLDKVIAEVMETKATHAGAFNIKKARAIGYLAAIKLRAYEVTEIEERLAALEAKRLKP